MESFKEAIRLGVHALELDIVVSGDNHIVVSHEPFMSQVTCIAPDGKEIFEDEDLKYNLYKMPYGEIKQFECGLKFHPKFPNQKLCSSYKPILEEMIQTCELFVQGNGYSLIDYIVEIKSKQSFYGKFQPTPEIYVELVLEAVEIFNLKDRLVLKSFDINILNEIKKQCPSQRISLLINRKESIPEKLKQLTFKPEILGPYFELLNEDIVSEYKIKGFQILPWTINEVSDMKRLISYGVDGIITDYPDRLTNLLVQ